MAANANIADETSSLNPLILLSNIFTAILFTLLFGSFTPKLTQLKKDTFLRRRILFWTADEAPSKLNPPSP
ncbi:MAG: hypothetical protein IPK78_17670 [Rhodospirillales bacterium]|nr:hypothetical protein [Rhodospirillales bacterium]